MTNTALLTRYLDQANEALQWLEMAMLHLNEHLDLVDAMTEEPYFNDAEVNRGLADALEFPARTADIARRLLDKTRRKVINHGLKAASLVNERGDNGTL